MKLSRLKCIKYTMVRLWVVYTTKIAINFERRHLNAVNECKL